MSNCKKCGEPVRWTQAGARRYCRNPDGSYHWDKCFETRWQQVKATGERFDLESESGYAKSIHGTKLDWMHMGRTIGAAYVATDCDCIPWEDCDKCVHGELEIVSAAKQAIG